MDGREQGRGPTGQREFWKRAVPIVLGVLIVSDIALSALVLISGQAWFDLVHGTDYVDPQALLKRTGAVWASQLLIQVIAFFRWRDGLHWLLVLAGVRWADMLSDWVYWLDANDHTWLGHAGLLLASPLNFALGLFFYRAYFALRERERV